MKQELTTGEKKLTCIFPVQYYLRKKKRREKQLKRGQYFRGRLVCIKGKNGKRWNLGKIKWQLFLKVQVRDETTKNRQKKKKKIPNFWLAFFLFNLIWKKRRKKASHQNVGPI